MIPTDIQIVFIGAAAAIDTALLVSLLERRNLRNITAPVVALLLGAWLFHSGEFVRTLLMDARGQWSDLATSLAMSTSSAGLLLMPSALLHGVLRIWRSGLRFNVRPDWRYAAAYLPLSILPVAMYLLFNHMQEPFLDRVAPLVFPVTLLLCAVNTIAGLTFLVKGRRSDNVELRRFLMGLALLLAGITGLLIYTFWIADPLYLTVGSPLLLAVILAPLGPILLFTYFVVRYRFMQLLIERTLIYGAILGAALLLHRVMIQSTAARLGDRFRIDFGIIEGVGVFLLVLLYQPIRRRVAESLRYLLGRSVQDVRERTRHLAVEVWSHLDDSPPAMVDWFVSALRESFDITLVSAWIFDSKGDSLVRSGDVTHFPERQARALHGALESHGYVAVHGRGDPTWNSLDLLRRMRASFAVRMDQAGFSGLLVLGPRSRSREYGEEEMNAVLLLVELLGATLHSHYLQAQRLRAERMAAQNEKLSAIGLLTSCLAHEIKNPLSSIKTIATVMSEQIGDQGDHSEDIRLILREVDRLSATTGQFLKFARPVESTSESTQVAPTLQAAVAVLGNLAHSKQVTIESDIAPDLPAVRTDENTIREIAFNLLLNAIEAVPPGGRVHVSVAADDHVRGESDTLVMVVHDNGPGICAELKEQIFAPFVSNKPYGTGLGLYIVHRHVEQLGGKISCESDPGHGTSFTVRLPFATPNRR